MKNTFSVCPDCIAVVQANWQENHGDKNLDDCMIKATFAQEGKPSEHMWCSVVKDFGKTIFATLQNIPANLTNVKDGQSVFVNRKDIMQHFCEGTTFDFRESERDKFEHLKEHLKSH